MAKIVSTKFGARGLVHLPPVSLSGKATPQVQSIAPDFKNSLAITDGGRQSMNVVPKEYAYIPPVGQDSRNTWLGPPERGYPQGNIVQPDRNTNENGVGQHMFSQLLQQSNVQGYQDYNQGYPVVPAVSGSLPNQQYAQQALPSNYAPVQQPAPSYHPVTSFPQASQSNILVPNNHQVQDQNFQQYQQGQPGQVPQPGQQPQYGGQPGQQPYQSSPYDKHIFYGPDGEVLPGPPPGYNARGNGSRPGPSNSRAKLEDFAIEGQLHFGHLKTVKLVEPVKHFPTFPDYLLKDLKQKYGQYETTWVRIISRRGEIHIHATPSIPGSQLVTGYPPQYMPVYIDEDEYYRNGYPHGFPQDRSPGPYRAYGTPPPIGAGRVVPYPINVPRPATEADPMSQFRWKKDDEMSEAGSFHQPVERSRASY